MSQKHIAPPLPPPLFCSAADPFLVSPHRDPPGRMACLATPASVEKWYVVL